MARPVDIIRLEGKPGSLAIFNSIEVTNDLLQPCGARFDIGDDGSYSTLYRAFAHAEPWKVYLNGWPRMSGVVVSQEIPDDAQSGTRVEIRLTTKMSSAYVASANPSTRVEKTSIADFIFKLYEPLGFERSDFVFQPAAERDLMTGKPTRGGKAPANLEPIKVEQAKVNPPETIYDAASRHLKRHGLMHWDAPDGRIFVGAPDVEQTPSYRFLSKRGARASGNNVLRVQRTADWYDVPSSVTIYGAFVGKDIAKAKIISTAAHADMVNAEFERPVYLPKEGVKTFAAAEQEARRELAQKSKRKDSFEVMVDGWSYWDGSSGVPYAPNTTADVDLDALGGVQGRYFCHRVVLKEDARGSQTATLSLAAPAVWSLFGAE